MQVRNDRFVFSNILNHTVPVNTGTDNAIKYSTAIMQALNLPGQFNWQPEMDSFKSNEE